MLCMAWLCQAKLSYGCIAIAMLHGSYATHAMHAQAMHGMPAGIYAYAMPCMLRMLASFASSRHADQQLLMLRMPSGAMHLQLIHSCKACYAYDAWLPCAMHM